MKREKVSSSNIEAIAHDGDETLEIEFINGSVYQYFGVPHHVFEELRDADSVGRYLAAHIKGVYRYSKV